MKNVMGIIYTGENDSYLRELSIQRAVAAMPVAGRYRVIDFIISSMVNSNMRNVGVIMQKNYHSLMDHLGSGKEYDLHGKNDGLFILPPFLTRENIGVYPGILDALRSNMSYLKRSRQDYVVMCNSLIIFNDRLNDIFKNHLKEEADITLLYSKDPKLKRNEKGMYLKVDDNNNVDDMEIAPTNPNYENTFMDFTIMKRQLLIDLVTDATSHGLHDLSRDVLQRLIREHDLKIMGREYTKKAFLIDSVPAYYQANMELLDYETRAEIFNKESTVYTKVRDDMPARFTKTAKTRNSLIADGVIISGEVENSVIFRGVKIAEKAIVKNCVIMQDAIVEEGAYVENCILDKQSVIKAHGRLIGPPNYPIVIAKNMIV